MGGEREAGGGGGGGLCDAQPGAREAAPTSPGHLQCTRERERTSNISSHRRNGVRETKRLKKIYFGVQTAEYKNTNLLHTPRTKLRTLPAKGFTPSKKVLYNHHLQHTFYHKPNGD